MKPLLIAGLLLASVNASADTYIDANQAAQDNAKRELIRKAIDICAKQKLHTVGEKEACRKKYIDEAKEKYPTRGTDEYSEKYYSNLTRAQAEQKLIELEKIWNKAGFTATQPGEIGRVEAENEGWWIQTHILKASPTQGDPWFIECKIQKWKATVDLCPLGKGGNP